METGGLDRPAVSEPNPPTDQAEHYAHLSQRAAAFIRGHGGAVHEDALVAHVFGSAGSAALWRPLLRQLVRAESGVAWRPDGYWILADGAACQEGRGIGEYVVIDVETTGLRPSQQRIVEVAAIRFDDGVEVRRFETLLNPERRLPRYVAELTGISDADLAHAPGFAEVATELLDLVGSSLLVGHNVEFDIGFLNAELRRSGYPALVNERIDTLGLAVKLLSEVRKPNLANVAQALGLVAVPRKLHRAGPDAALTGAVARHLFARARQQGITSIDALKGTTTGPVRSKEGSARGRSVLDRSLLTGIPKAPGVYLMRDAFDQVIYVGKAKNLRDRVGSYYSQPLGYTRKMDGLLESLTRIEVEVVGSELEALLLEVQLIRRYQPRYNTALRASEHYPFIRIDVANSWPRVSLARACKEDGARYFGPFRNTAGARKTVELINRVVPLRTCSRSFKDARSYGSPCLELDLGRCLGPCVGRADREVYAAHVRDVVSFLDGRDQTLYEILWQGLEEAAAKLDFERAADLRRDLTQVSAIVTAQRRLREAMETHTLLLVLPSSVPDAREVMLVVAGRLWAQFRAVPEEANALTGRLAAAWERLLKQGVSEIDHSAVDEANIVNRWLYQHAGHPAILPLSRPPSFPDWPELVRRLFALREEHLTWEPQLHEAGDIDDAVQ